jgi:ferredoxin
MFGGSKPRITRSIHRAMINRSVMRNFGSREANSCLPSKIITFDIPHLELSFEIKWRARQSILDIAGRDEVSSQHIEGACSGSMACYTCHFYLDNKAFDSLGESDAIEHDLLDMLFDPRDASRLGCQVKLTEALMDLDEIIVTIQNGWANNVWD